MNGHRSWCKEHQEGYCYSTPSEPGKVYLLADQLDEQPYVFFYIDGDSLPVDAAEKFAQAILAQVARARSTSS